MKHYPGITCCAGCGEGFTYRSRIRRARGNPRFCEKCFAEYEVRLREEKARQREEAAREMAERQAEWDAVRLDTTLEELVDDEITCA